MKKRLLLTLILCLFAMSITSQAAGAMPFQDVPQGSWYYDSVQYVYNAKIMTGLTDNKFGPMNTLSRAQAVTVLYRLAGSPNTVYSPVFKDVANGQFYTPAVMWAYANGIATGYEDGRFYPGKSITREQLCTFLYRYRSTQTRLTRCSNLAANFPDGAKLSKFAVDAVNWAVNAGIIKGKTTGFRQRLANLDTLSRAECATMIMRFMNIAPEQDSNFKIGSYNLHINSASRENSEKNLEQYYNRGIDCLAVQEMDTSWERFFRLNLPETVFKMATVDRSDLNATMSVGIIYNATKMKLENAKAYILDRSRTYDSYNNRRYVLACQFSDTYGRKFVVLSSHLEWVSIEANAQMAQDVYDLAAQYAGQNLPVYICGDFNNVLPVFYSQSIMNSGDIFKPLVPHRSFDQKGDDFTLFVADDNLQVDKDNSIISAVSAINKGYLSVYSLNGEKNYPLSWPELYNIPNNSSFMDKYNIVKRGWNDIIDNVYYSSSKIGAYTVTPYDTVNELLYPNASDHNVVYSTFRMSFTQNNSLNYDRVAKPERMEEKRVLQ